MPNSKKPSRKGPKKNIPHDALIKKVVENQVARIELLEECLPTKFKSMIDMTTAKVEKETFVEQNLAKQLSDVVLSVQTKEGDKAFIYILLEAQVKPDYFMALRLWKYTLLLCERHQKDKKFPLVCPLLIYHGNRKYNAPRNLWELFADPAMARKLLTGDYHLIDLQAMADDKINYSKHLSIILYLLKHIHQRDTLKLVEDIFKNCRKAVLIDQSQDYLYIKLLIWSIDNKVPVEQKQQLTQIITENLQPKDSGNVMRSIAQAYIEEGEARGEVKKAMSIARNLLKAGLSPDIIADSTGLSKEQVKKLK